MSAPRIVERLVTSQLRAGDVVRHEGGFDVLLSEDARPVATWAPGVFVARGTILPGYDPAPWSWPNPGEAWTVQGNDTATWAVVRAQ